MDPEAVADDLASIDASATEVVLRRAVQLAGDDVVVAERMPVSDLAEAAAELHLPAAAVADALAEYRAGALNLPTGSGASFDEPTTPRPTMLDRVVGPGTVSVVHRTGLSEGEAAASLGEWLKRGHRLRIRTNRRGAIVGVRRRGVVPSVERGVRSATGTAGLAGVREVRAAAVGADERTTSICLVADVSDARNRSVATGGTVAAGGTVVVSAVALLTGPAALAGVPVALGIGWVTSRIGHARRLRRVAEEVEMTADNVAAGARPPTIVDNVVDRFGRRPKPT